MFCRISSWESFLGLRLCFFEFWFKLSLCLNGLSFFWKLLRGCNCFYFFGFYWPTLTWESKYQSMKWSRLFGYTKLKSITFVLKWLIESSIFYFSDNYFLVFSNPRSSEDFFVIFLFSWETGLFYSIRSMFLLSF